MNLATAYAPGIANNKAINIDKEYAKAYLNRGIKISIISSFIFLSLFCVITFSISKYIPFKSNPFDLALIAIMVSRQVPRDVANKSVGEKLSHLPQ